MATAVAVFSKEIGVIVPAVLVLYEIAFGRRYRKALLASIVALVPIAAMLYLRSEVLAASLPARIPFTDNPLIAADFWTAKLAAVSVIGRYLGLLVWPATLSADYSYAQITPERISWLAVAAAGAAAFLARRSFFAGFALLALVPASNLLFPIGTVMAERLLYLPAVGFSACLVLVLYARMPRIAPALLCVVIAALAARTWLRNLDWRSDLAMARSLVQTSPLSFKSHRLLAQELYRAHAPMQEVIAESEKSLAILDPLPDSQNSPDTWRLAAGLYFAAQDWERCAGTLRRALAIVKSAPVAGAVYAPKPDMYRMLAAALHHLGRLDDEAVTLMEAQFATGDFAFRDQLLALYRSGFDREGCAILPDGALNPNCALVRRHLCAALPTAADRQTYGCR